MMRQNTMHDRAALNAAFARHVARVLEPAAAYAPADTCPQGHARLWGGQIGDLCHVCYEYWRDKPLSFGRENPTWHPEWRIGPGAPHDFCASLDRTVGALLRLGLRWDVATQGRPAAGPPQSVVSVRREGGRWADQRYADALIDESPDVAVWATALVRAALRVLADREAPDADGAEKEEW